MASSFQIPNNILKHEYFLKSWTFFEKHEHILKIHKQFLKTWATVEVMNKLWEHEQFFKFWTIFENTFFEMQIFFIFRTIFKSLFKIIIIWKKGKKENETRRKLIKETRRKRKFKKTGPEPVPETGTLCTLLLLNGPAHYGILRSLPCAFSWLIDALSVQ